MKIVFLDRDGTINKDPGYLRTTEGLELLPGAASAIGDLQRADFRIVVVSNQSAIGRGIATVEEVEAVNRHIAELLAEEDADAKLDMVLYAPDHPDTASDRRKPGIGMLRDVSAHWQWSREESWMVGDRMSDIEFGLNGGLPRSHCLLLGTATDGWPMVFSSLRDAAEHILATQY